VDHVTVFSDKTCDGLLLKFKPDVHAKGSDYTPENLPERDTVLSYGGEIAITGGPKDHSTTAFIEWLSQYKKQHLNTIKDGLPGIMATDFLLAPRRGGRGNAG